MHKYSSWAAICRAKCGSYKTLLSSGRLWKQEQEFLSHIDTWIYVEQNLTSDILMSLGKSRCRNIRWFLCKVCEGFILSDENNWVIDLLFENLSAPCLGLVVGNIGGWSFWIISDFVVKTIKTIQCAGTTSEMQYYDRMWSETEPMELSTSCILFLSASPLTFHKPQSVSTLFKG